MQLTGFNLNTGNDISALINSYSNNNTGNAQRSGNNQGGVANEKMLDSMVDSMIKGAFDDGEYAGNSQGLSDDPLMQAVAKHMDENPDKFPPPHDGNGHVRNWTQELAENNSLSGSEMEDFKAGLKDMLSTGGLNGAGNTGGTNGTGGSSGTSGSNGINQLADLLKGLGQTGMNDSISPNQNGGGQIMELFQQMLGIIAQMMDGNQGNFGSPQGQQIA